MRHSRGLLGTGSEYMLILGATDIFCGAGLLWVIYLVVSGLCPLDVSMARRPHYDN